MEIPIKKFCAILPQLVYANFIDKFQEIAWEILILLTKFIFLYNGACMEMKSEIAKVDIGEMTSVSTSLLDYFKTKNTEILDAVIDKMLNKPGFWQRFLPASDYDKELESINIKRMRGYFENDMNLVNTYANIRLSIIRDRAKDVSIELALKGKAHLVIVITALVDEINLTIKDSQNKMWDSISKEEEDVKTRFVSNERILKIALEAIDTRLNLHMKTTETLLNKTMKALDEYSG